MRMHIQFLQFYKRVSSRPNSLSITLPATVRRATATRRASAVLCWSRAHYYSLQPLPKQPAVVRVFSAERPHHAPSSEPRR